MPRLIWTPEAIRDIQICYRFLAPKNPTAAKNAIKAIREGMCVVAEHPDAGRPVKRMDPEFREWLVGFGDSGYVVLYRYDGESAVVLAVRHQREAGYG